MPTVTIVSQPGNPLSSVRLPWLMEIGGWVVFAVVAGVLAHRWWKRGEPSTAALLFIACFTMFWQEFYADWGAYLYYNPQLHLLPWGPGSFNTPNKPVYVLAGYGWFYAGAFPAILAVFAWARRRWPGAPYLLVLACTALVPFYLWNLLTADLASYLTNWYQYLHPIGPAIHTSKGGLPLLYPAFPFVLFAPLVVFSLDRRGADGRTWFERVCRVPAQGTAVAVRQVHRVVAWIVGLNVMYAVCLTIPLVLIRILFLPDNVYVP
ncbi:hypothetical protein [Cryptosporangium aurantiacum]|uniref:Spirocyclase, AveC family n=1 Tax=Cryptosporangium aurantiacum TaxID=134849 RepID=A0A1M7PGJ7_9ACTN|nr:hypothetical protein [Cryptosporangium aurantiacum]SHN15860.1 hypothetical protein SAMN05443668_103309 [Cryptosporangium aurantiacum]